MKRIYNSINPELQGDDYDWEWHDKVTSHYEYECTQEKLEYGDDFEEDGPPINYNCDDYDCDDCEYNPHFHHEDS